MNLSCVLLDTSFFLRFLKPEDPLFRNADDYYKYFLTNNFNLAISTISIAEYCVGGKIDELPLRNLRVIPFNIDHAQQAGSFAKEVFLARKNQEIQFSNRIIIPNDTKLFAQAEIDIEVKYFLTSDSESIKVYNILKNKFTIKFNLIDLSQPYNDYFQILKI